MLLPSCQSANLHRFESHLSAFATEHVVHKEKLGIMSKEANLQTLGVLQSYDSLYQDL
jgi:hypothetical protein